MAPQKYNPEQVQAWADAPLDRAYFREFILDGETYILEDESGIVGFGSLQNCGHFSSLYVRHDRTRQGIGSALILWVIDRAKVKGIERFMPKPVNLVWGYLSRWDFAFLL